MLPGATTVTTLFVKGSVPVPEVMVCLPLIIPEFEVPIGQQAPVSPSQPLRSPFSKPMFGQVWAKPKDDISNMRR